MENDYSCNAVQGRLERVCHIRRPENDLPARSAVQDALYPCGQGSPGPLGCGGIPGLPGAADADLEQIVLWLIDGRSPPLGRRFHDAYYVITQIP
jgi:hypothetical protein